MEVFSSLQIYRRTEKRYISQGRFGQCSRRGNRYALVINVVYLIVFIFLVARYIYKYIYQSIKELCSFRDFQYCIKLPGEQEKGQKLQKFSESLPGSKGNGSGNQKRKRLSRQSSNSDAATEREEQFRS